MRLTFVTPAWGRYPVTHLALAQRRWLCDLLALRGITADCIVVADDANLDIARGYGFKTIERPNLLGYKLNSGFAAALDDGADYVSFVGSDDWMHPDLFDVALDGQAVVSGRKITLYDLISGVSKVVGTRNLYGVIPWLIPRKLLEGSTQWVPQHQESGLDIHLALALGNCEWHFHDPHPLARVDFKSDTNLTPFGAGLGPVAPPLFEKYPEHLVQLVVREVLESAA